VTRPLIGLTGRRKKAGQLVGTPEVLHELEGDWYYADYARGVLEAGGLPVHLPLDARPELFADRLDGVLFSGGADIDARHYGEAGSEHNDAVEPERDDFELNLFKAVAQREIPVLGICRGIQLINVASGGTLHQHVPAHAGFSEPPATLLHSIDVLPDSVLGSIYGEHHQVNSLHHQTLDRVADGFRITAQHDGSVEGIEHESMPIVAVQWHPEMLPTRANDPIFRWLVDAAS
jgi:putative glutamine amidotransferase